MVHTESFNNNLRTFPHSCTCLHRASQRFTEFIINILIQTLIHINITTLIYCIVFKFDYSTKIV